MHAYGKPRREALTCEYGCCGHVKGGCAVRGQARARVTAFRKRHRHAARQADRRVIAAATKE